jgi:hypothetical protein
MQTTTPEDWQDHIQPLSRWVLVGVGFLQGLAVYALLEWLPDSTPQYLRFMAFSLLMALPWMLVLIADDIRDAWTWYLLAGYGLVLAGVAVFTGSQCTAFESTGCDVYVALPYIGSQVLGWCLLSIVFRTVLEQRDTGFAYPVLFKYSWHNFFTVILAGVYALLTWLLLILGAGLFKLVEIDLFLNTLREEWFALPLTGTALAYGAVVARQQLTVVTTLRRLLRTVIGGMLPLLALIGVGFLLVLPFTGVQPLWDTNRASLLMLWLVAFLLFFSNAAIQYGDDLQRARVWMLLIRGALIVLPVYLLLTGYALWLRIDQYGWSVTRVWAVIASLVFSGYALCYALGIVAKWNAWTLALGRINTLMLAVIIGVLMVTNTPLLNVSAIVANSQVSRLLSGETVAEDFDYRYINNQLGKPGRRAIEAMLEDPRFKVLPDVERLAQAIASIDPQGRPTAFSPAEHLVRLPAELEVPEALYETLEDSRLRYQHQCRILYFTCYISRVPLREDVVNFVLLMATRGNLSGQIYEKVDSQWQIVGHLNHFGSRPRSPQPKELLDEADIRVVEPTWRDIVIGGNRMRIYPATDVLFVNPALGPPVSAQGRPVQ